MAGPKPADSKPRMPHTTRGVPYSKEFPKDKGKHIKSGKERTNKAWKPVKKGM